MYKTEKPHKFYEHRNIYISKLRGSPFGYKQLKKKKKNY